MYRGPIQVAYDAAHLPNRQRLGSIVSLIGRTSDVEQRKFSYLRCCSLDSTQRVADSGFSNTTVQIILQLFHKVFHRFKNGL